jgi:hypothetical protein
MRATTKQPVLLEPTGQHPDSRAAALEALLRGVEARIKEGAGPMAAFHTKFEAGMRAAHVEMISYRSRWLLSKQEAEH